MRRPWYVAYKADGGNTMQVYRSKRAALRAAAVLLQQGAVEVEAGPMLDTREGVLRGDALRRIVTRTDL